jgi:hypothetical protein
VVAILTDFLVRLLVIIVLAHRTGAVARAG